MRACMKWNYKNRSRMWVLLFCYSSQLHWLSQQFTYLLSPDQLDTHERHLMWGAEEWSKTGIFLPQSSNNIRDFLDSQQNAPPLFENVISYCTFPLSNNNAVYNARRDTVNDIYLGRMQFKIRLPFMTSL